MSLAELVKLIKTGHLEIQGRPAHWWTVHLNGRVREFEDGRFEIPCRAGFKLFFDITEHDLPLNPDKFRIDHA